MELSNVLLSVLAILLPALWVYIQNKFAHLNLDLLLVTNNQVQAIYLLVVEKVKAGERNKDVLISFVLQEAKQRGLTIIAPYLYGLLVDRILKCK